MTRFLVTGIHPVAGTAPGDEFDADFSEEQERALVAGGAIKRAASRREARKRDDDLTDVKARPVEEE